MILGAMSNKELKRSVIFSTGIVLSSLMLFGCGEDNINKVKNGYFPQENRKSVSEVLSLSPYASKGSWSNLASKGEVPIIGYECALPNDQVVDWVLPKLSQDAKSKVLEALDKNKFAIKLKLNFALYKNGSFDVEKATLSYQDQDGLNDKEVILDRLINQKELGDLNLSDEAKVVFNQALYSAFLDSSDLDSDLKVGLFSHKGALFNRTIFSDSEIYYSFHPLTLSSINSIAVNNNKHLIELNANTKILDLNDYKLNEVGLTIFTNGYGLIDGSNFKSDEDILKLIDPYSYDYLLNQDLSLSYNFNDLAKGESIPLKDLEQGSISLVDVNNNKAYLALDKEQLKLSFEPQYDNNQKLKDFIYQEQIIIDYTAIAYPLAFAATSFASLTKKQSDADLFQSMISIRNKFMKEGGDSVPDPLKKGQSI